VKYPQSHPCNGRLLIFNSMLAFTKKESAKKAKEQVICLLSFASPTVTFSFTPNMEMPGFHDMLICYTEQEVVQMISVSLNEKSYSIINPLLQEQQ
jgi:hypothetical protein